MALVFDGTNGLTVPTWTTATRPIGPAVGQMGYNTTIGQFDIYTANGWVAVLNTTSTTNKPSYAGSVLQIVNGFTTTTNTSTTTTVIDTSLTATITPTSSTNKILVLVSQRVYKNQPATAAIMYLQRGGTNLLTDNRVGLNDTTTVGGDQKWSCCYLDSPATTSATTYKTQFSNYNTSGVSYVNLDNNQAQITLMEIAQ
jgi:hypothetical protein